jgi:lipopolysaccharide biosynthesis glycosyltransferase
METMHVASCVDKKYLQHLGVLLTSLLENKACPGSIAYHVVHDDLDDADKKSFAEIEKKYHAAVIFHDASALAEQYTQVVRYGHVSRAGLYRLSIPEILPPEVKKVLYLDCDIVINGDIFDLWSTNVDGYVAAAVEDAVPFSRHRSLMMPEKSLYFNSGVLLINMEEWRSFGATAKVFKFMVDFPERRVYNDQDGLNAILHSRWLRLPPKYNQQSALHYLPRKRLVYAKEEHAEALSTPAIIHYTGVVGNTKPWRYVDVHPLKKSYYKYLRLSAWHTYVARPKSIADVLTKAYLWLLRHKMRTGIVFGNILKPFISKQGRRI